MKRINILVAAMAFAMFAIVSVSVAQDTKDLPPCIIVNGVKCYVKYDECRRIIAINCPGGSSGTAQFKVLLPDDPCAPEGSTDLDPSQPIKAALQPVSISVSVSDPDYGTISTSVDPTRTPSNTTIESINGEAGEVFPLKVRIRFYALATVESEPGATYVSQSELIFGNDEVNSVAPFQNETFTLQNDVVYYRQGDESQAPAFTLQAGTTNLTIDGEEGRNQEQNPNGDRQELDNDHGLN